jgi:hypothetical protein
VFSLPYVCQVYVFGEMRVLLKALEDQVHAESEVLQLKASAAVRAIADTYDLTGPELDALNTPGESVERLKAMLVEEHNKVSAQHSPNSALQVLSRFRTTIEAAAKKDQKVMPTDLKDVPMKILKEIQTWCGLGTSQFYRKVGVALLPEKSYQLVVAILQFEEGKNFEKAAKQKNDGEPAKAEKIKLGGLEALVADVDEDGIYAVLLEVKKGTRDLSTVKAWVAKWKRKKRTCFSFFFLSFVFVFRLLVMFFCTMQMWWTFSCAMRTGTRTSR